MRKAVLFISLSAILIMSGIAQAASEPQKIIKDAKLTTEVESALLSDAELKATKINVQASADGSVTLSGSVGSENQKLEATHAARQVTGINSVANQLKVAP